MAKVNDIAGSVEPGDGGAGGALGSPTLRVGARRPRVAIAHDWLVGLRGGEWVLDAIIRAVSPWADITGLYVMFDDGRAITPTIDAQPRVVAHVGRLPGAASLRRWMLPLYPMAVEQLAARLAADHAREPVDLVISTSSAAMKGLRTPGGVPHICYCHAPARYLWSRETEYAAGSVLRRAGLAAFGARLRAWDKATAANVTTFIANSRHTASDIRRCYGRDSIVIHPPVRTAYFTPAPEPRGEHWLVVAALEPYKRVDLALEAAALAGKELRIVGDGSQRGSLERLARGRPGVTFLGRIGDDALRDEYRRARLLLFPQVEDFGIVGVEALACGLPVVARGEGGALDFVLEGVTGALFHGDSPRDVLGGVARCPREASGACASTAAAFGEARFASQMTRVMHHALNAR